MNAELLSRIHSAVFPKGWDEKAVEEMLAVPGTFALVASGLWLVTSEKENPLQATRHGPLATPGMIIVRVAGEQADLITLAVLPEFRRRGVARGLLKEAMQKAAKMGAERLFLEVEEDNLPAQQLYATNGFSTFSRRKEYYGEKDAIVMCAGLP